MSEAGREGVHSTPCDALGFDGLVACCRNVAEGLVTCRLNVAGAEHLTLHLYQTARPPPLQGLVAC